MSIFFKSFFRNRKKSGAKRIKGDDVVAVAIAIAATTTRTTKKKKKKKEEEEEERETKGAFSSPKPHKHPPRIDVRIRTPAAAAPSFDGGGAGAGPRTTTAAARRDVAADDDDGVSAMTPATGIPPDSPTGVDVIDLLLQRRGDDDDDDDVSTVTGAVPSPERVRRPTVPTAILPGGWYDDDRDDDSDDGRLTVYEEDDAGSVVGGGIVVGEDCGRRRPQLRGREAEFAGSPQPSYQCRSADADAALASAIGRREARLKRVLGGSGSWLTRTGYFRSAVDSAFCEVAEIAGGSSGRGGVTLEGLRAGLLSVHLSMATYVGSPACRVRASFVRPLLRPPLLRSLVVYLSRRSFFAFALDCESRASSDWENIQRIIMYASRRVRDTSRRYSTSSTGTIPVC